MSHPAEDTRMREDRRVLSVWMPVKELEALQRMADAEERTLSGQVRFLLRQDIEEGENAWSQ